MNRTATLEVEGLRIAFGRRKIVGSLDFSIRRGLSGVLVLAEGRIVEDGPIDEILNRPRHPFTCDLVGCAC